MENSKIEWTHHTFNPWVGCTKVSDGCKFCYAEKLMDHRYGKVKWGPQGTRQRTSAANWRKPLQWSKQAQTEGKRYRVFCASLADVFEDRSELAPWRAELLHLIQQTPNLNWLLLTKRPENVSSMIEQATGFSDSEMWFHSAPHVWIGTTVENQHYANERVPHLLKVPAKVRFLSMEPLLGEVDLRGFTYPYQIGDCGLMSGHDWLTGEEWQHSSIFGGGNSWLSSEEKDDYSERRIHWVITGGESGPNARPMHPSWVRSLRDQCERTGVPFFFKQWGEHIGGTGSRNGWISLQNGFNGCGDKNTHEWDGAYISQRVGKKAAGRLLDGVEYSQFPQ